MILGAIIFSAPAQAYTIADYYRCTRDQPIIQAMEILERSPEKWVVKDMVESDTRVLFKNMQQLSQFYENDDALSVISNDGHHIIYINMKHYNAPPQALAATLSHEIMHSDRFNSIHEEMTAWTQEAKTWQEMLQEYPQLQQIPRGEYPLVDRLNAIEILIKEHKLEDEIRNNPVYKGLPEHSPGF